MIPPTAPPTIAPVLLFSFVLPLEITDAEGETEIGLDAEVGKVCAYSAVEEEEECDAVELIDLPVVDNLVESVGAGPPEENSGTDCSSRACAAATSKLPEIVTSRYPQLGTAVPEGRP